MVEMEGKYEATPHDIEIFSKERYIIPLAKSTTAFRLIQRLTNDERFIVDGNYPVTHQGEINETTKKHLLSDDPASGPEVVRGGNIQRYMFTNARRQGDTKYLKEKEYLKSVHGERTLHTQRLRIGFQRGEAQNTRRRLLFTLLSPPPCYCFDTVSYFLIEEEADFFYLALFNSQLMEWLFKRTSTNNHISKREIAALPIRRINLVTPFPERDQISVKLNNYINMKQHDLILQEVTRALFQQPDAATDIVRDLLASLAKEMIELNQQKLLHQQTLFTLLASELGLRTSTNDDIDLINLASLKRRGELLDFAGNHLPYSPELSPDRLWHIVQENKKHFLPFTSKTEQNIKIGYQKILSDACSTIQALKATDRLIDDIIYKLYDLTPEEIKLIEGRG